METLIELARDWQTLATGIGLVACGGYIFVGAIAKYTAWRGDDKVAKWLKWVHDRVSSLSLGNQQKLLPPEGK